MAKLTTKNLSAACDTLYKQRAQRLELQRQVDDMKAEERGMEADILAFLQENKLTKVTGQLATVSVTRSVVPEVEDWAKVRAYIKKNDAFELMHQRLAVRAWAELNEAGKKVPGVVAQEKVDLSITKAQRS